MLYPVISSRRDLVLASFTFTIFLLNIDNITIEILIRRIRELSINHTLSNRYNGSDLMFQFKEGLSLTIRRISFSANINFLISLASTLKHSNDGECLQSNKWSLTALPLGLSSLLSQWWDSGMLPKFLYHGVSHVHHYRIHCIVHTNIYKRHQM